MPPALQTCHEQVEPRTCPGQLLRIAACWLLALCSLCPACMLSSTWAGLRVTPGHTTSPEFKTSKALSELADLEPEQPSKRGRASRTRFMQTVW